MTTTPQRTLLILNPHAAGGRAGQAWRDLEPLLWTLLGELLVAVTERPEDVAVHLEEARSAGIRRVIAIGGDGTNHCLINALADLNSRHPGEPPLVYGSLPIGTGRDWARGQGIPYRTPQEAARWIARATPIATDIGQIRHGSSHVHFLNIASVGLGGDVAERVNAVRQRRPWTFLRATVSSLIQNGPLPMQITLDGVPWFDGKAYVCAVANGSTFGHGMQIAPNADVHDGAFDVVLVKGVPRLDVLLALQRVFNGTHLTHPAVEVARAREVRVSGANLPLEMDGEPLRVTDPTFTVQPGALSLLSAATPA